MLYSGQVRLEVPAEYPRRECVLLNSWIYSFEFIRGLGLMDRWEWVR